MRTTPLAALVTLLVPSLAHAGAEPWIAHAPTVTGASLAGSPVTPAAPTVTGTPTVGAGPTLAFPAADPSADDDLAALAAQCDVTAATLDEQAALEAAAQQVRAAYADPAVRALLLAKTDWRLDSPVGWIVDTVVGLALGHAVVTDVTAPIQVAVLVYGAGPERACLAPFGAGAMNAWTRSGVPVIYLYRPYLAGLGAGPDATHALARTLAHELAHVLGYLHQDDPYAVGTPAYANTVPPFLGCLAELYPDLAALSRCGDGAALGAR